ncbi:MAG: ABC transporter ATP-binding protein [Patescibacteria group bacterium]|jgi:putative ABC transport system ATP-binding protein
MIECQGITKIYQTGDMSTTVLDNVSLKISDGEFTAIVGPSGSGKSTLMHILGALDTPTNGKYFLDGKDVSKLDDDQLADLRRTKIGFVFQAFNLLPRATVLRNVCLPLIYSNITAEKRENLARQALKDVGLDEVHFNKYSNQLSGGQMQRVAIARAMVNNPTLILADEPTGNLDTKTSQIVMDTFKQLNRKGRTIVLITHEHDIAQNAKRIISIRDGQIEKDTVR